MKASDGKSTMALAMRLLREERKVENAFRLDHEFREAESEKGRLFLGQSLATPPTWQSFVDGFARTPQPRLANQSCGSVLFLTVPDPSRKGHVRTMALTFGTGHHALDLEAFERNFGLRVVLNSVPRNALRSLDVAILDATTFQKRIQSSRKADLNGFGINVERDLLRLAAGVPTEASFARSAAGRDALTIGTRTSPEDVIDKCTDALRYYNSKD